MTVRDGNGNGKRAAELEWVGFKLAGLGLLGATVRVEGARSTLVHLTLSLDGRILDLQADDYAQAGTTGEEALDAELCAMAAERLSLARDADIYTQAIRHRDFSRRRRR